LTQQEATKQQKLSAKVEVLAEKELAAKDRQEAKAMSPELRRELWIEVCSKALNDLLLQKQPKTFERQWIKQEAPDLWLQIMNNVIDQRVGAGWAPIIKRLDPEFQIRWKPIRSRPTDRVDIDYNDPAEVEDIINQKRDKLYTFLEAPSVEDRQARDELCVQLCDLAQRGNVIAREKLMTYVGYTINTWLETKPGFEIYKYKPELIMEVLERCVRKYKLSATFYGVWSISLCWQRLWVMVK